MRALRLNMTMSLDGFVAGPHFELDWMTTAHDAELTADIVTLLNGVDEAFMGYPTAEGMIRYWAAVAQDPAASQARDIAHAVSDCRMTCSGRVRPSAGSMTLLPRVERPCR